MEKKNCFLNLAVTEGHFAAFTMNLLVLSINGIVYINGIVIHELPIGPEKSRGGSIVPQNWTQFIMVYDSVARSFALHGIRGVSRHIIVKQALI
jgi:hypothetical protein